MGMNSWSGPRLCVAPHPLAPTMVDADDENALRDTLIRRIGWYGDTTAASAAIAAHGRRCLDWVYRTEVDVLQKVIEHRAPGLCAQLIALGADVNKPQWDRGTPYSHAISAVKTRQLDILRMLHAAGANLSSCWKDWVLCCPLGVALVELSRMWSLDPRDPEYLMVPIAYWLIGNPDVDLHAAPLRQFSQWAAPPQPWNNARHCVCAHNTLSRTRLRHISSCLSSLMAKEAQDDVVGRTTVYNFPGAGAAIDVYRCQRELQTAVKRGNLKACAQLIARGADVNYIRWVKGAPYSYAIFAVQWRRLEVLRMLHAAGANLNSCWDDWVYRYPLAVALRELEQEQAAESCLAHIALWLIGNPDVDLVGHMGDFCHATRWHLQRVTYLQLARRCVHLPELAHAVKDELAKRVRWSRLRTAWFCAVGAAAARCAGGGIAIAPPD